jgi:hypothetical protein
MIGRGMSSSKDRAAQLGRESHDSQRLYWLRSKIIYEWMPITTLFQAVRCS